MARKQIGLGTIFGVAAAATLGFLLTYALSAKAQTCTPGTKRNQLTDCWDGVPYGGEQCADDGMSWVPIDTTCPIEPLDGAENTPYTLWDGTTINMTVYSRASHQWLPKYKSPYTCWDGSVIYLQVYDRITHSWGPSNLTCPTQICVEGTYRNPTTCYDGTTVYGEVCQNNAWVSTGLTCPVCSCTEGTYRGPTTCWDGSIIMAEVCHNCGWTSTGQTCPPPTQICTEGQVRNPTTCWDGSVVYGEVCHNNAWVSTGSSCPPPQQPKSTTMFLASANIIYIGTDNIVDGTLMSDTPVVGRTVRVVITLPNGTSEPAANYTTDANGQFSFIYTPTTVGTYNITGTFAGDSAYFPASDTISFSAVEQPPPPAYNYLVSSNVVKDSNGATVYTGSNMAAALKWATSQANKTTYVPAGMYTLSGQDEQTITPFASGATLTGAGRDATVLNFIYNTTAYAWHDAIYHFGLKPVDVSNVTIKDLSVTGDGGICFYTTAGKTTSNNTVQDVRVYDQTDWCISSCSIYVANDATTDTVANGYKFIRVEAYNVPGYAFGTWGAVTDWNSVAANAGHVTNLLYDHCIAHYVGYYWRKNNWCVGFDIAEQCNINNVTFLNCEADYCWESGIHFEHPSVTTGTATLTNCTVNNNGQKWSEPQGAGWGYGLRYVTGYATYNIAGLTGTGNKGGLTGYNLLYSGAETDDVVGWTYKVVGSTVTNYSGGTAYSGASFTAALQWACSQANAVVYVPHGGGAGVTPLTVTSSINIASGVTLLGDLPCHSNYCHPLKSQRCTTYFAFPNATSGFVVNNASNTKLFSIGTTRGRIVYSGTGTGNIARGLQFADTVETSGSVNVDLGAVEASNFVLNSSGSLKMTLCHNASGYLPDI